MIQILVVVPLTIGLQSFIMSNKLLSISLLLLFSINLYCQQEDCPSAIKFNLKGKQRLENISYDGKLIFPKGEIISCGFSSIDTSCFKPKYYPINNSRLAKELISYIEKGKTATFSGELTGSIEFLLKYKDGRNYSFYCSKNYISIWLGDTTIIIKGIDAFLRKVKKLNNDFVQDIAFIKNIDKIELKYKKNKRIITDSMVIASILECLKEAKYSGSTSCPFYNGRIKLYSGSKLISASLAHDSCPIIIINKNYFNLDKQRHKKLVRILYRFVGFKPGP